MALHRGLTFVAVMIVAVCAAMARGESPVIHSVRFLDASPKVPGGPALPGPGPEAALPPGAAVPAPGAKLPGALPGEKLFDPAMPYPGLPVAQAEHMVKAGAYKSMDCLVQGDRCEYWADDLNGQFLTILPVRAKDAAPAEIKITLSMVEAGDKLMPLATSSSKAEFNKASFLIDMSRLKAGNYRVTAGYVPADAPGTGAVEAAYSFTKSTKQHAAVTVPADGIPIVIEAQAIMPGATWPMKTGVPLPIGAVMDAGRLALFENGVQVPAKATPIAWWCPEGSIKWVHLDFIARYKGGKTAEYKLKLIEPQKTQGAQSLGFASGSKLTCTQTEEKISVDTGFVRFEVNKKKFTGIDKAWYDAAGKGTYDEMNPLVQASAGPYLVDGRIIRFDASHDKNATVVVEEAGPTRVTIAATGWYVSGEGRVEPLCMFKTRIHAYAGEPMLRISHHTILTYDTRMQRLHDVGFHIGATGDAFEIGADGKTVAGAVPKEPASVYLHQDRFDHFRLVGARKDPVEGKASDGWFALGSSKEDQPQVSVLLRDIWQKFPKEVELASNGLTVHFWPKHGQRAFKLDDELALRNIYKFWCFHQGPMLDLVLPNDYFQKLAIDFAAGSAECRPEHALNGNAQGVVIGNDFAVLFSGPAESDLTAARGAMFQRDPTALAAPKWNADSGAMGRMAGVDRGDFAWVEEMIEKAFLSHTRGMERAGEYGMWNYADTHTYWNAQDNCAELHRVWHNSHYHEMGMPWMMYFRTASADMLRWARACGDHWMNVDTINYVDPKQAIKYHMLGGMYHCKGLTHWGGEVVGMFRRDGHAGVAGHWTDPDALLWNWYLSGNERAFDVYQLWARTYAASPYYGGTRREANTTFANMINYYEASWDPNMLPPIRGQGISLRLYEPLEKQNPGPMWHPLWINRYYDLTRDPEYVEFIKKYARMLGIENTWTTGLGALAYEITGDATYLTDHGRRFVNFPRQVYHAPGDLYDWYGIGPGPLGEGWGLYLTWGRFLRDLQDAKITRLAATGPVEGNYLTTPSRYDYQGPPPSLAVYAVEPKDQPFTVTYKAGSLGGDLHRGQILIFSPSGKELLKFEAPSVGGPSGWSEKHDLPADGETGLYRFELRLHEANVTSPIFSLPYEAAMMPKNSEIKTSACFAFLRPSDASAPVELTVTSPAATGRAANVRIEDGKGKMLLEASLFGARNKPTAAITLDPAKHPLPWKLDVVGMVTVKWTGTSENLMMATSDESLQAVLGAMKKK